jgi:hypothetical protein
MLGAGDGEAKITGETVADLKAWKVSPARIAAMEAKAKGSEQPDVVEVEPENWDAFRIFRQMQTQWRQQTVLAGNKLVTLRTGLDYSGMPAIASALRIVPDQAVMDAIRAMEAEAINIHSDRQQAALRR